MRLWITLPAEDIHRLANMLGVIFLTKPKLDGKNLELTAEVSERGLEQMDPNWGEWIWGRDDNEPPSRGTPLNAVGEPLDADNGLGYPNPTLPAKQPTASPTHPSRVVEYRREAARTRRYR